MAAPTKQEMLENVEIAINARMTGGAVQSYTIGGRNIQYIGLEELRKLRDQLRREIAGSGGTTTYASFGRPS
jgi:predicted PilT family ATPase